MSEDYSGPLLNARLLLRRVSELAAQRHYEEARRNLGAATVLIGRAAAALERLQNEKQK